MSLPIGCPACGSAATIFCSAVDENRRVSPQRFEYAQCAGCKLIFLPQAPADLGRYYESDYYAIPALEELQTIARKDPNKIDLVRKFATGGRLLEIGPAFGVFAWQAKDAGFTVDAIEMDSRCCEFLRDTLGVNAIQSDAPHAAIATLPSHEVIAIWHVLEHLPQPFEFLQAAAANLAPGGVLVIAMPNPQAFQFRLMGRHWPHLDAPRHLTLIPLNLLTRRLRALDLEPVYVTSDDSDARSWNRFGWQRLLMNRFRNRWLQRAMFVLGYGLSWIMAPLDRRGFAGSAYTIVFKKKKSS